MTITSCCTYKLLDTRSPIFLLLHHHQYPSPPQHQACLGLGVPCHIFNGIYTIVPSLLFLSNYYLLELPPCPGNDDGAPTPGHLGTFTNGRLLSDGMGVKGTGTASTFSSPIPCSRIYIPVADNICPCSQWHVQPLGCSACLTGPFIWSPLGCSSGHHWASLGWCQTVQLY